MKKLFTLIAMVFASGAMMAQTSDGLGWGWDDNSLKNSNLEGTDDFSGFAVKPNFMADGKANTTVFVDDDVAPFVVEGEGVDGSKCIKVVALGSEEAPAANGWDSQFWIRVPEGVKKLDAGDMIYVAFDYKATWDENARLPLDEEAEEGELGDLVKSISVGTQAHATPGQYNHWACIGNVEFTREWQRFEGEFTVGSEWTANGGFLSIAFNLCDNNMNFDAAFFFDNVVLKVASPNPDSKYEWIPLVSNGDFEGEGTNNYQIKVNQGDINPAEIEEGIGVDGSRGIKMVVAPKVSETWDSQFWIKFKEGLPVDEVIKVKFDYKATKAGQVGTQSHQEPSNYIHWDCIGSVNFTEDWQTFEKTVTVSSSMTTSDKIFTSIAFNMAIDAEEEVTYYFDNISVTQRKEFGIDEDPYQSMLEELVADCSDLAYVGSPANAALREAFQNAYRDADGATDDFEALADALREARSAFEASIKDYARLQAFIDYCDIKVKEAEAMGEAYAELKSQLDEFESARVDGLNGEEWGKDEINAAIDKAALKAIIGEFISGHVQDGDNITILFDNPTFAGNVEGWSRASGNNIVYGPSQAGGDDSNTIGDVEDLYEADGVTPSGVAEVWHAAFDTYQEFTNLPAGLYSITLNACQRVDTPEGEAPEEMKGYLYALVNGVEQNQLIMSIYDDVSEVQIYDPVNSDRWPDAELEDGTWVPNGTGGANFFFNAEHYKNTFNVLVNESGATLRFGLKNTSTRQWVVFDNVKIQYLSLENIVAFQAAVQSQIDRLKQAKKNEEAYTDPTAADMKTAIEEAEDLLAGANTIESCKAMIEKLGNVYNAAMANATTLLAVQPAWDKFEEAYYTYGDDCAEKIKEECKDLAKAYGTDLYMGYTTEELKTFIAQLEYCAEACKIPAAAWDVVYGQSYDLTEALIPNPDFEDYATVGANADYPGWSGSGFGTGGGTAGPVGERWNQTNGFNTYIDLAGLPEGDYVLSCNGGWRIGGSTGDADYDYVYNGAEYKMPAYLYATTSNGTEETVMHNLAECLVTAEEAEAAEIEYTANCNVYNRTIKEATDDEPAETVTYYFPDQLYTADQFMQAGYYNNNQVKFTVPADGKARIGVKRASGAASGNWCFVDNFSLVYYGKNPNAIESIVVAPAQKGIYTISGVRINSITKPGLYIVNGAKVLVK